ncbi:MAG: hypothetical protein AAF628_34180 [Planctomycetota bacterium]
MSLHLVSMRWVVVIVLAGCASAPDVGPPLPFHVAVAPVQVPLIPAGPVDEAEAESLQVSFDSAPFTDALTERLATTFSRVTPLSSGDDVAAMLATAQSEGVDLILEARVVQQPGVDTWLNQGFWPNLLLHALGGPGGWFVSDRTYAPQVQLQVQVYDATTAAAVAAAASLEATGAQLLRVERPATEVSLNFLDRADSASHWLLGLVVPAGFLGYESAAVAEQLSTEIAKQLADSLAQALRERAADLERPEFVRFYPRDVRTDDAASGRALTGEMVVEIGHVDELGALRYRFANGSWQSANWSGRQLERASQGGPARRSYGFRIPLTDASAGTVQLEVEQVDRGLTRRTFTYALDDGTETR